MNEVKKIAVISASPKVNEAAVSEWLASHAESILAGDAVDIRHITVRKSIAQKQTIEDFAYMFDSDAMLIVFPLYIFCLPGMLIRFLQDYSAFVREQAVGGKKAAVYAVVNCGFPEPDINTEAVGVIKSFSRQVGAEFRFGIMLGSGGMIIQTQGSPLTKQPMVKFDGAMAVIKEEVLSGKRGATEDIEISVNFPRFLYFFIGSRGWISRAKKNGHKKKDMYAQPY